ELRARVLRDSEGSIIGNAGTIFDITDRYHAEQLLSAETRVLELIARDAALRSVLDSIATLLREHVAGDVDIGGRPMGRDLEEDALAGLAEGIVNGQSDPLEGEALVRRALPAGPTWPARVVVPIHSAMGFGTVGELVVTHHTPMRIDRSQRDVVQR